MRLRRTGERHQGTGCPLKNAPLFERVRTPSKMALGTDYIVLLVRAKELVYIDEKTDNNH